MYTPALKMAAIKVKGQICVFVIIFFVMVLKMYITKIIFPSYLETEILIGLHECFGDRFEKRLPLRSRVKFGMAL